METKSVPSLPKKKHKFKTVCEKWEYALYRIKGGKSLDK